MFIPGLGHALAVPMAPGCDGVVGADAALAFLGKRSQGGGPRQLPQLGLVP